jgi:hypothetical protein
MKIVLLLVLFTSFFSNSVSPKDLRVKETVECQQLKYASDSEVAKCLGIDTDPLAFKVKAHKQKQCLFQRGKSDQQQCFNQKSEIENMVKTFVVAAS